MPVQVADTFIEQKKLDHWPDHDLNEEFMNDHLSNTLLKYCGVNGKQHILLQFHIKVYLHQLLWCL